MTLELTGSHRFTSAPLDPTSHHLLIRKAAVETVYTNAQMGDKLKERPEPLNHYGKGIWWQKKSKSSSSCDKNPSILMGAVSSRMEMPPSVVQNRQNK